MATIPSLPAVTVSRSTRRLSITSRAERITSCRSRNGRRQSRTVDYSTLAGPTLPEDAEPADEEFYTNDDIVPLQPGRSFLEVEPIDLRIRRLTLSFQRSPTKLEKLRTFLYSKPSDSREAEERFLLRDISVNIGAGTLTAIIGASGSGKTTLLSAVARQPSKTELQVTGTVTFNWYEGVSSAKIAYARQDDDILSNLTIREVLAYAARLRLLPLTATHQHQLVTDVIDELGLSHCADQLVCRCSGGEKRRASIGSQLIQNPSILLLDEPTTGLDATSALSTMNALKKSALKGRTVIAVLHSPRPEIFELLDRLLVMADGGLVYAGKPKKCVPYFAALGFKPRRRKNHAESILEVASIDHHTHESLEESRTRVATLRSMWASRTARMAWISRKGVPHRTARPSPLRCLLKITKHSCHRVFILTQRSLTLSLRDKVMTFGILLGGAALGLALGIGSLQLPRDLSGIRSRQGVLYGSFSILSVAFLTMDIHRLVPDYRVFDQECEDGMVNAAEFVLSRRMSLLLVEDFPVAFIFSVVLYFMADLRGAAGYFFIFFLFVFISLFATRCFSMLCLAIFRDYASASVIAGLFNSVQIFCGGFEIQKDQLPTYVRWLRPLAFWSHTFAGLASNEFSNEFFDCPIDGGETEPACLPYTGKYILSSLGFTENSRLTKLIIVFGFSLLFILTSIIVLHFHQSSIKHRGKRIVDSTQAPSEAPVTQSIHVLAPGRVGLYVYGLSVYAVPGLLQNHDNSPCIVDSVNLACSPGTLTAIIGPSGSGKSTLLKAIVRRERQSYSCRGLVKFNDQAATPDLVKAFCAFVAQEDKGLIPTLTVRETLRFAALLRLPSGLSQLQKYDRADSLLNRLGLHDCASLPVGDANSKGISGGQRRRISIGLQLLREPQVLILDEPTSGLDAATASSIIGLLKSLTREGRTVLTAVHQIGADDFGSLDNVVLMAQGRTCFTGPSSAMLPYFEPLGYYCRKSESPADFASDLLNGEYRWTTEGSKIDSHTRVLALAINWARSSVWFSYSGEWQPQLKGVPSNQQNSSDCWHTFRILLARSFKHHRRNPDALITRMVPSIVTGILQTLFFAPLRQDQAGVQTYAGFVFMVVNLCEIGLLANTAVYPVERDIFLFDFEDGASIVEAFLLQYMVLEVLCQILSALFFSVFAVFAVGLPRTSLVYFATCLNMILLFNSGESLGILFFSIFTHTGFALIVANISLMAVGYMAGLLTPDLPAVVRALNNISPMFHATANLFPVIMRDLRFTCTSEQTLPDGSCVFNTGQDVLELFHLDSDASRGFYGLFLISVGLRILAYIALKIRCSCLREKLRDGMRKVVLGERRRRKDNIHELE